MTQKETIENNRLIAEFMGLEPNRGGEYEMYQVLDFIEDKPRSKHFYFPSEMMFHESWDWLMLVIEEISKRFEVNNNFHLYNNYMTEDGTDREDFLIFRLPLETAFLAVVDFIKWHNKQKES